MQFLKVGESFRKNKLTHCRNKSCTCQIFGKLIFEKKKVFAIFFLLGEWGSQFVIDCIVGGKSAKKGLCNSILNNVGSTFLFICLHFPKGSFNTHKRLLTRTNSAVYVLLLYSNVLFGTFLLIVRY